MKHLRNISTFHLLAIATVAMMVSCGVSEQAPTSETKYDIPQPPARFTPSERKAIRDESSRVTAEAQSEAEKVYPMSDAQGRTLKGNLENYAELSNRLTAEAEQKLLEKYGLEKMELLAILRERVN